jgi:hypothetical protein
MTDGPIAVADRERTAENKQPVTDFVALIMMGADRSQLPRFFAGDHFLQHNPVIADGVSGLGNAIQTGVWAQSSSAAIVSLPKATSCSLRAKVSFTTNCLPSTTCSGSRTASSPSIGTSCLLSLSPSRTTTDCFDADGAPRSRLGGRRHPTSAAVRDRNAPTHHRASRSA